MWPSPRRTAVDWKGYATSRARTFGHRTAHSPDGLPVRLPAETALVERLDSPRFRSAGKLAAREGAAPRRLGTGPSYRRTGPRASIPTRSWSAPLTTGGRAVSTSRWSPDTTAPCATKRMPGPVLSSLPPPKPLRLECSGHWAPARRMGPFGCRPSGTRLLSSCSV